MAEDIFFWRIRFIQATNLYLVNILRWGDRRPKHM